MTSLRVLPGLLVLLGLTSSTTLLEQSRTFESLLAESGMEYTELPDGGYRVWVAEGVGVPVLADVHEMGNYRLVYIVALVLRVPESGAIPGGLYRAVASINAQIPGTGNIGMVDEPRAVVLSTSLWLDVATPELLRRQVVLANRMVQDARDILQPHVTAD